MYPEYLYFFKQLAILLSAHTYYTHIVFDYKDRHFPVLFGMITGLIAPG
jgi:hypothetical protein